VAAAAARGIEASFQLLPVANALKKPGPVFNALAAAVSGSVLLAGGSLPGGLPGGGSRNSNSSAAATAALPSEAAAYIYRVNDDTEFRQDAWTSKFVAALQRLSLGSPGASAVLGVVGPSCPQGNRAILTHDFTHATHLRVFGTYYPPELVPLCIQGLLRWNYPLGDLCAAPFFFFCSFPNRS
jgi:hypothetical protein